MSKLRLSSRQLRLVVTITVLAASIGASYGQAAMGTAVDGTITAVGSDKITIAATDGSIKTAALQPSTLYLASRTVALDSAKTGEALGVAATREADGTLTATVIRIFTPKLWEIAQKGQFPMQSGQIMTNAQVTRYVQAVKGRVLTMKYGDLITTINVPDDAKIYRLVAAKLSDLKEGMHVVVRGTANADGSVNARVVSYDAKG